MRTFRVGSARLRAAARDTSLTAPRRPAAVFVRLLAAAIGLAVCCWPSARAATLTWGTDGTGGSGTWDTTTTGWWDGTSQVQWNNLTPDSAVFAGTAGTVDIQSTITAGTIAATTTGYTLSTSNSSTLTVSTIDLSSLGSSGNLVVSVKLTGSQPLALKSAGNTSANGGGDGTLGIRLTNTGNDFTGDVTISSGLVSYANNSVFGNAANKLILTGGGLLDNNVNVALSRPIVVSSGTNTFRTYGSTNVSWSSTVTGGAVVNHTDGGTLNFTGDWSGFTGTYVNQAGTTKFQNAANVVSGTLIATAGTLAIENTGSNTISAVNLSSATLLVKSNSNALGTATVSATNSTIGSQTSSAAFTLPNAINVNGTLTLNATNGAFGLSGPVTGSGVTLATSGATTNAVTLSGTVNLGTGSLYPSGNNKLTIAAGANITSGEVKMFGGTDLNSILQVDGGLITTKYLSIGNDGNGRGTVNQTSGTLSIVAGSFGTRLGHWSNGSNPASQYNLTGGLLDASALAANSAGDTKTVNIGWDGQMVMTVGGGAGLANLKAYGIAIDTNGGGAGAADTLIVSNNGLVQVGAGGITSADSGDMVILNSGTVTGTAAATWGSVISATAASLSTLDSATFAITLSNNLTSTGTINLAGSGGFNFSATQSVAPALTGTAPITKSGAGTTTTFTGTFSPTGNVSLSTGTLQLSGTGSLGYVDITRNGSLVVATGANVTTGTINKGDNPGGVLTIQPGATLTTGSYNNSWAINSLTVNGTWNVTGGMNLSVAATTTVGGTGTINTNRLSNSNGTTQNLTVSRMNIGSGGIGNGPSAGTAINLNGVTLGASANWTSSVGLTLVKTTTFNTLDSADNTTPRTITLSGALSGSAGMGLVKVGSGTLSLGNNGNSFSGDVTVNSGVLAATAANSTSNTVLGAKSGSRTITVNSGATMNWTINNVFSGGGATASGLPAIVVNGGTFSATRFNTIGNITLNSGATLTQASTDGPGSYEGYQFIGTVTVGGNSASTIASTNGRANHLLGGGTTAFNVADVTSSSAVDLTVTNPIKDGSNDYAGAGALRKSGAGTMAISAQATYTGGTIIDAGVLDLTGGGGSAGTIRGTATVNAGAVLRLSTADATGYSGGSTALTTINLVGGTLSVNTASNQTLGSGTLNLTGGFITGTSTGNIDFFGGGSTLNTLASSTTSVISGVALSPLRQGSTTFTVASGSAPGGIDLEIQSNMQTTPSLGGDAAGGQFIKAGAGTLRVTGSVTYGGTTAITAGTLQVGGNGTTGSIQNAIAVSSGGLLAFNRSDAYTYSSSISGSGNVSQIGSGTLTLSGSSIYTGNTTLAAGVLALGNADAIGTTGTISFTGGRLQYTASNAVDYSTRIKNSSAAVTIDTNSQNVTFAGVVDSTNTSGLTKFGSGTLTLSAANTYAGNTTISAGVLRLGSGGSSGSVGGNIVNNAKLVVNRSDAFALSGIISGSGALVQAGTGTTTLSAVNSYSGATTITGGALAVSTDSNLGAAPGSATPGSIVIDGGLLAFTSGFTLTANRGIALGPTVGSGSGTIDVATGQSLIYGGVLANSGGTGGLAKTGAGTLQLSGLATYTGNTSVDAGTLQVGAGASLASPLVAVASGATLSGRGTVNATTVADGGILWPGVAGAGTLTTGELTFSGSATVTMGSGTVPTNLLNVIGNVTTLGSGTSVTFAFGGGLANITTGTYSLLTYTGTLSDASAFGWSGTKGGRQQVEVSGTTAGAVSLIIGNAFPLWTGTNGNDWFAADNWELNTDLAPTNFQNNDTVDFNDLATLATGTVVISGSNATPASVTFSADTKAYTLEGAGGFGISTGAVVKSGSALVTITSANTYDGGTTLSAGRLRVGDNAALGTGDIRVTAPAALSSNGVTPRTLANAVHLDANVTLGDSTDTGALTFSGTVTFDGASRTITTLSNVTLSGAVTNGGLTKSGSGTLTITGSNTYADGTTLSAGTLRVGNNAALGPGSVTLNGGAFSSDGASARTLANAFTLGGDVTLGDATNTGALTLGAGGVSLGGMTRQVTTASDVTFAGAVTNGGLAKTGAGTLTLVAANSYGGGTTLAVGDILLGNVAGLGTGTATYAGPGTIRPTVGGTIANAFAVDSGVSGTFDSSAIAVTLSGAIANAGTFTLTTTATQTLSGAVSGTGTIVKAGSGGLTLSGANTLTGAVSLTAGRLNLNSAGALGTGSLVIASASTIDNTSGTAVTLTGPNAQSWNADFTFAGTNPLNLGTGAVTLGADRQVTVTSSTLTVGGIGGGYALTKAGAGTLSLAGAGSYSGGTTLSAGTLLVGNATALGTGTVTLNGGTLYVNGVTAANDVVLGGGSVDGSGGTLSGVIVGTSKLGKIGSGTLAVTGPSTFTGGVGVDGGVLEVSSIADGSPSAIGAGVGSTGYIGISSGATFRYTGAASATSARWLWFDTSSASIDVQNAAAALTLNPGGGTRNQNFTKAGAGTLVLGGDITGGASVTVTAGVLALTAANSYSGGSTVTGGTLQIGAGGTAGSIAGNVAVNSAGALAFNRSDAYSYSGLISGSGAVRQVGTGTTTLGGSNTFSGTLTIAQGGVAVSTVNNVSSNGALGNSAGAVVLGSSGFRGTLAYTGATASSSKPFTLATGGTGAFDVGGNVKLTLSGLINGSGGLVKVGSGTLTVTTTETYTGPTVVDAGVFELATPSYGRGLATSGVTINAGATFLINGMNNAYGSGQYIPFTVNSGTLQIGGTTGGNHCHLGSLTLNAGTLYASNPTPYSNQYSTFDATITVGGTARSVIAGANSAYGYSLANTGRIFDVGATGDPSGVDLLVSAPFLADGTTGVVKNGAGVMSMTGTNTYSGNTVINAGTYKVSGGGKVYAGTYNNSAVITVNTGGTLELDSFAYDAPGSTGQLSAYSQRRILAGGTISVVGTSHSSGNNFQVANGSSGAFNMTQAGQLLTLNGNTNSNISIGGPLTFGGAGDITVNDVIENNTGAGSIVKSGAGTLTFGGTMTYTGDTTISSGTFVMAGAGQLGSGNYAGAIANAGAFVVATSANQTFSGVVSGAGSFAKSGAGALSLTNASNSFAGGVSLTGGVLSFVAGGLGSTGPVALGGGTLQWAGSNTTDLSQRFALTNSSTTTLDLGSNDVTLASGFGGGTSGSLVKVGAGTLALTGSNDFTGGTTLSQGTMEFVSGGLGSSGNVTLAADTVLRWAAGNTQDISSRLVLVGSGNVTLDTGANNVALANGFGGGSAAGLTKTGAGILTLSGSNGYTGATAVAEGTLAITGAGSIASSGGMSIASGAALDISGASALVDVGTLSGAGNVTLGGNTLRTTVVGESIEFNGVISGSGGFTKAGPDSLRLTDAQTFTGTATVEAGTLVLANGTEFEQASVIAVLASGVLDTPGLTIVLDQTLAGRGTVYGPVTFAPGAVLAPGGSVGGLTNDGSTTWNGGMRYVFEVNDATGTAGGPDGWDLYNVTGDLVLAADIPTPIIIDLTSLSGTSPGFAANFDENATYQWLIADAGSEITTFDPLWFSVETTNFLNLPGEPGRFSVVRGDTVGFGNDQLYLTYVAIPEPATLVLAGIGLAVAGLVAARRRRHPRRTPTLDL